MSAVELIGTAHTLALFGRGQDGVVIDTATGTTLETAPVTTLLARANWSSTFPGDVPLTVHAVAASALGSTVTASQPSTHEHERYTVPKSVRGTARRALATLGSHPERRYRDAQLAAKQLAAGNTVSLSRIEQIARALTTDDRRVFHLWGGQSAQDWTSSILAMTAAGPADPVLPDDTDADPEDQEPGESRVVPVEFDQFIASMQEGLHQFTPDPNDDNTCLYCGNPEDDPIHQFPEQGDTPDLPPNDPYLPHYFQTDPLAPDDPQCFLCALPADDPIHEFSPLVGPVPPATGTDEADTAPTDEEAPPAVISTGYNASDLITAEPVLLAAILHAEAMDNDIAYYAVLGDTDRDLVTAVLQKDQGSWSAWDPENAQWTAQEAPTTPIQLLDEATAYTLCGELAMSESGTAAISLRMQDLDEQALFDAAREELDSMDLTFTGAPFGGTPVIFVADIDTGADTGEIHLRAVSEEGCQLWNYADRVWEITDCDGIDTSGIKLSLDDAMLVAYQQTLDGTYPSGPTEVSPDEAASALEDSGFFDLLVEAPNIDVDPFIDDSDDPEEREHDQVDFDFGYRASAAAVPEPWFGIAVASDPARLPGPYAVLNGGATWLRWNAQAVGWQECAPLPSDQLRRIEPHKARALAANAYAEARGRSFATLPDNSADRVLTTIQHREFLSGFAPVFAMVAAGPLLDPQENEYTAEERSKNATKQLRDRFGRFATSQARVMLPNGSKGTINKIDTDRGTVEVKGDDGYSYDVPATTVQVIDEPVPDSIARKFDPTKIEAQPRATARTPKAALPYLLPPMNAAAIQQVVANYQKFIDSERASKTQRDKARAQLEKLKK